MKKLLIIISSLIITACAYTQEQQATVEFVTGVVAIGVR